VKDYTLKRKTDAKGQRTEYSYDAYKLVTETRRGTWGSVNNIVITASGGAANAVAVPVTSGGGSIGTFTPLTAAARDFVLSTTGSLGQIHITWNIYSNQSLNITAVTANGAYLCGGSANTCQLASYDGVTWFLDVYGSGIGTGLIEDFCQREDFYYDANPFDAAFSENPKGRLTAVVYRGGYNSGATPTCDTTFTEMMSYHKAGAVTKKRLRVKRGTLANMDLDSSYGYDNEGRNVSMQYPSTWNATTSSWDAGPNLGTEFNGAGQLNKLKDLTANTDIISGATYNAMGELLTMTGVGGAPSETRSYNSIGQMKQLQTGGVNVQYNFSSTNNNGKIASETDVVSGETVTSTKKLKAE
jgi:YD repeat-containing protein